MKCDNPECRQESEIMHYTFDGAPGKRYCSQICVLNAAPIQPGEMTLRGEELVVTRHIKVDKPLDLIVLDVEFGDHVDRLVDDDKLSSARALDHVMLDVEFGDEFYVDASLPKPGEISMATLESVLDEAQEALQAGVRQLEAWVSDDPNALKLIEDGFSNWAAEKFSELGDTFSPETIARAVEHVKAIEVCHVHGVPKGFDVAALMDAVKVLEANNIPPATCEDCGGKFYLFVPPGTPLPITTIVCDDCIEKARNARREALGLAPLPGDKRHL